MRARILVVLATSWLLAGCADLVTPVAHSTHALSVLVRITVDQRDVHGSVGLHDAVRFVRITGPATEIRRALQPTGRTDVRLPKAGSFVASSWSRSCGRTCDTLRPAGDRCEMPFTATAAEATDLEVRFARGGGCAITVSG